MDAIETWFATLEQAISKMQSTIKAISINSCLEENFFEVSPLLEIDRLNEVETEYGKLSVATKKVILDPQLEECLPCEMKQELWDLWEEMEAHTRIMGTHVRLAQGVQVQPQLYPHANNSHLQECLRYQGGW